MRSLMLLAASLCFIALAGCYCGPGQVSCQSGPVPQAPMVRIPTSPASQFSQRMWPYLSADGSVGLMPESHKRDTVREWTTPPRPQ